MSQAYAVNVAAGEEWDVNVSRPSKWGNPFSHKSGTRAQLVVPTRTEALRRFCWWLIRQKTELIFESKLELAGQRLACDGNCLPMPCHAEIWAEIANGVNEPEGWFRAGGDCLCTICNLPYIDHRPYMGFERPEDVRDYAYVGWPWLHVTCTGMKVKL